MSEPDIGTGKLRQTRSELSGSSLQPNILAMRGGGSQVLDQDLHLVKKPIDSTDLSKPMFGGGSGDQKIHDSFKLTVRRPLRASEPKKEYVVYVTGTEDANGLLDELIKRFNLDRKWWRLYATRDQGVDLFELKGDENLKKFENKTIYLYPKFFSR
jgi:hypothetical protein